MFGLIFYLKINFDFLKARKRPDLTLPEDPVFSTPY